MAYRIERDETVGDAFRRVARKQSDAAIDDVETAATSDDSTEAVQLYAEPPKRFSRRLERYWDKWQRGMIAS